MNTEPNLLIDTVMIGRGLVALWLLAWVLSTLSVAKRAVLMGSGRSGCSTKARHGAEIAP